MTTTRIFCFRDVWFSCKRALLIFPVEQSVGEIDWFPRHVGFQTVHHVDVEGVSTANMTQATPRKVQQAFEIHKDYSARSKVTIHVTRLRWGKTFHTITRTRPPAHTHNSWVIATPSSPMWRWNKSDATRRLKNRHKKAPEVRQGGTLDTKMSQHQQQETKSGT